MNIFVIGEEVIAPHGVKAAVVGEDNYGVRVVNDQWYPAPGYWFDKQDVVRVRVVPKQVPSEFEQHFL